VSFSSSEPLFSQASEMTVTDIKLAKRFSRLCAAGVDFLILIAIYIPIFILALTIFILLGLDSGLAIVAGIILAFCFALIPAITLFFAFNFRLLRRDGQTIGKRVFKIKIVRSDGTPAGMSRILFLRYLLIPILTIPTGLVLALVDVLLISSKSRQCLHDMIADTIVVERA